MKLRQLNVALAIGVTILLSACGGNTIKEKTIKASDIAISGDGSEYIKVVDGEYTMKTVDDKVIIPIKLELTKSVGIESPKMGNLSLIPLDKSGAAVPDIGLDFSPATMSDWGKVEDLLSSEVGKVATISFEWSYFASEEKQARIMEQTENFEITRADITSSASSSSSVSETEYDNDDENVEETVASSGSEDWDEMLDDYEEYVDEYIKFYKKAMKGDNSAMSEYPAMMEKATALQQSMAKAQNNNELSATQIQRMMKIQTKMTNAALEMQN
ncbi:MAG: hypothetical protein KDE33_24145 [Bacteroidetes bacterium]|nr:hypothetical protein [Bacteroidota bacterium]MCB9227899.1 hypothetical protein [Chitinophagales bacterium]